MAGYGSASGCDRCRFCGLDLPMDPIAIMTHYNNHWRQYNNIENLSLNSCAYEPQLDIRISPTPINPDDLEVCSHNEQNFEYSYSPQSEPSNLSLGGTRCSPLNLTGRSKSESPLASPLPSEPRHPTAHSHQHAPAEMNIIQPNPLHNMSINSHIGISHNYAYTSTQTMFPNCSENAQLLNNVQMNNYHTENSDSNYYSFFKKRKRMEKMDFQCMTCSRLFCAKELLNEHSQVCPNKDVNVHQNTNSNDYLMNSQPINQTMMPYKCSICDQEFMYKEDLAQHNNNHLASKRYKCELCGTGLSHLSALKRHSLSHSGHKPHTCTVCGRGFFQKCDLQRHYGTHNKKKKIECSNCKKKYFSGIFPKNHRCKPPEGPKPFKCSICGEGCSTNIGWSYHMWKHTKDPAFVPCQTNVVNAQSFDNVKLSSLKT